MNVRKVLAIAFAIVAVMIPVFLFASNEDSRDYRSGLLAGVVIGSFFVQVIRGKRHRC